MAASPGKWLCFGAPVEVGSAIEKSVALVRSAAGVQHLIIRADVNVPPPIVAKVTTRECAVVALAGIADRDVGCNPAAYQPVQEAANPISGIGRKLLWLQAEAPPSVRSSMVFVDSTSS
jgi:hypothetical protein